MQHHHRRVHESTYEKWGPYKLKAQHAKAMSYGTAYGNERAKVMEMVYHKKYGHSIAEHGAKHPGVIHHGMKVKTGHRGHMKIKRRYDKKKYHRVRRKIYLLKKGKHMTVEELAHKYNTNVGAIHHVYKHYKLHRSRKGKGKKHMKAHHHKKYKFHKRAGMHHHRGRPPMHHYHI